MRNYQYREELPTTLAYHEKNFREDLTELIPHLRAFSRSLCGNATLADDIVQDALAKAWAARKSYKPGTNMKAWVFTILRNQFYSIKRRSWRAQSLDPDIAAQTIVSVDTPEDAFQLNEVRHALSELSNNQREALILVGAAGFSYDEAADICGVRTGTIKSRVSRARRSLVDILEKGDFSGTDDGIGAIGAMDAIIDEASEILDSSNTIKDKTH